MSSIENESFRAVRVSEEDGKVLNPSLRDSIIFAKYSLELPSHHDDGNQEQRKEIEPFSVISSQKMYITRKMINFIVDKREKRKGSNFMLLPI